MKELRNQATDRLFETVLKLKTVEECYDFFEDLCTIKDLQDLSQRMEVATLLHEGQSFLQISAKTGASTATIGRVNKCLNYGSGGYRRALQNENE